MAKVFGVCGKKQCGKNSLCNAFRDLLPQARVTEFAFAKALKDLAVHTFSIPAKSCYGSDADKNYPIATWGKFFNNKIIEKYGKQSDSLLSGREFLQILGTDIMRDGNLLGMMQRATTLVSWIEEKFGSQKAISLDSFDFKNIWANVLVEDVRRAENNFDIITVSDVRFFNEIDAIKRVGGKVIRLHRNAGTTDSIPHPSELEMEKMDDSLFDYVLQAENNVVLKDLKTFAINILMNENVLGGGVSL